MITLIQYIEMNLVGIIFLGIILHNQGKFSVRTPENTAYKRLVIYLILVLVLDTNTWIMDGVTAAGVRQFYLFICILYFLMNLLIPFQCFKYATLYAGVKRTKLKKWGKLIYLPTIIGSIFIILSFRFPIVFSIDAANFYRREPGIIIVFICAMVYCVASGYVILAKLRKAKSKEERIKAWSMLSLLLLPTIGTVIQLMYYGISLVWVLSVVSLWIVFLNIQNSQISTDPLTGLNNRLSMNSYINSLFGEEKNSKKYSIIMMDVDNFKKTNDIYGHVAGDKVLVDVAQILRKVSSNYSAFAARYGGDEFVVICKSSNAESIIDTIKADIKNYNLSDENDCDVSISIGRSIVSDANPESVEEFINKADIEMFKNKKHDF